MGVSVYPKIVLGINLNTIVVSESVSTNINVHTIEGIPTGEVIEKIINTLNANVNGKETHITVDETLYIDELTDLLETEDYPSEGNFGIDSLYCESDVVEDYCIGVKLLEIGDVMYRDNAYGEIDLKVLEDAKLLFKEEIKKYGVDIEPTLILIGGASY
jgi:hypothetical protein